MMIAGRDRFRREIAPEATGVYCVIECDDLFDGVELATVIAFFVKSPPRGERPRWAVVAERPARGPARAGRSGPSLARGRTARGRLASPIRGH